MVLGIRTPLFCRYHGQGITYYIEVSYRLYAKRKKLVSLGVGIFFQKHYVRLFLSLLWN